MWTHSPQVRASWACAARSAVGKLLIPYTTIPYTTIPYTTIPYTTIPYTTIPFATIPYHSLPGVLEEEGDKSGVGASNLGCMV